MRPQPHRLRIAEWLIGLDSAVLLIVLFAMPWFGYGGHQQRSGWQSLSLLGPLALVLGLLGLAVVWFQATRPAPALPVCATVFALLLSLVLFVGLLIRVLVDPPGSATSALAGVYVGLACTLGLGVSAYRSLRDDGIAAADAPGEIELVTLGELAGVGSPAPEP